mgnify:CR=1 FL=1
MNAMDTTGGQDFVFAISVQGHGEYPEERLIENPEKLVHFIDLIDIILPLIALCFILDPFQRNLCTTMEEIFTAARKCLIISGLTATPVKNL